MKCLVIFFILLSFSVVSCIDMHDYVDTFKLIDKLVCSESVDKEVLSDLKIVVDSFMYVFKKTIDEYDIDVDVLFRIDLILQGFKNKIKNLHASKIRIFLKRNKSLFVDGLQKINYAFISIAIGYHLLDRSFSNFINGLYLVVLAIVENYSFTELELNFVIDSLIKFNSKGQYIKDFEIASIGF